MSIEQLPYADQIYQTCDGFMCSLEIICDQNYKVMSRISQNKDFPCEKLICFQSQVNQIYCHFKGLK